MFLYASRFHFRSRSWCAVSTAALTCCILLDGCGFGTVPLSTTVPSSLSNNWSVIATPAGVGNLSRLTGSILIYDPSNGSQRATAGFITYSDCFALSPVVPSDGTVQGTMLSLYSFQVRGQYLDLVAFLDADQSHLSGTFAINGGCGNGQKGTILGTRYNAFTGSYAGSSTGQSLSVTVTQQSDPTGVGTFVLGGSLELNGPLCKASGILTNASFISGGDVHLTATLPEGVAVASGTLTSDAATLVLSSFVVTGGPCAGSYQSTTLAKSAL